MLTTILVFLCALLCLYLSYKYAVGRPEGFPPGPPRIPFFGSYLFLMMVNFKYLQKAAQKFSHWYKSDIIGFYVGPFPVVVVHSMEGVREVLFRKDFDGRPQLFLGEMRDPDYKIRGIFFEENALWKEQRRFMLRHLRDFGFGRRFQEFESIIQEEIGSLLDLIRNGPRYEHEKSVVQPGGYKISLPHIFGPFVFNCLLNTFYNDRHLRRDQASTYELVKYAMNFQRTADDYGKLLSIMPWIRYIFPNWSSYNILKNANGYIYNYFENIVNHHLDKFDENDQHSFIDLYIKKMKDDMELSGSKSSTFNRDQFIFNLIDFSFPALTAIGIQISLLIQYILLYPEVKTRIQKEIDDVVGNGRLPTLDDRSNMDYTEATIREILRIETLVPSGFPHKTLVDTELMGYRIPKDTVILTSLYAFHADKRVWGDPETFRPERFLDQNNRLSLKSDVSLPFGAGKRLCAGETFARNMLFLLVAAFCQNFDITTGPEQFLPDLSKNLNGLVISPPDFWLQLQERKS